MLVIPAGTMPTKPVPVDTLLSVLRKRLRGEKDVSVRRFIRQKIREVSRRGCSSKKKKDPFLTVS